MERSRPVIVRCQSCTQLNRVDLNRLSAGPKCAGCLQPLHLDRPLLATTADFDRTVQASAVPVVVDFYADWCGPCRMMAPVLDSLAAARAGSVLVLKVDTDKDPGLSERYGVRGIPTLVVLHHGKEVGRHVGLATRVDLERLIPA